MSPGDSTILARRQAALHQRPQDLRQLGEDEIRALPALHFYSALQSLGLDDAGDLLRHGTPAQVALALDLDVWRGDQPDYDALGRYLAAGLAADGTAALGGEGGALSALLAACDSELLTAWLRARVAVAELHGRDVPPEPRQHDGQDLPRLFTPDGLFVVESRAPLEPGQIDPTRLVDLLYRLDADEARRMVYAALWEQTANLEEEAYRFRGARLSDEGFPPLEEAQALYSPPPRAGSTPAPRGLDPAGPVQLPRLYLLGLPDVSLLVAGLGALDDERVLARIEQELTYVINAAAVAEQVRPGDLPALRALLDRVAGYLDIALARRCHGAAAESRPAASAAQLAAVPVRQLFREGFGATWDLAQRASRIRAQLANPAPDAERRGPGSEALVTEEEHTLLSALLQRRPRYVAPDELVPELAEPFRSLAQVREVEERLDALEGRLLMAGDPSARPGESRPALPERDAREPRRLA